MPQLFTNNARALLASGITDSATSLTVEASKADLFPTANVGSGSVPSANNWFKATLQDAAGNVEIVYVRTRTAGSGVFSNVIRGQEGTTARACSAGTVVGLRITSADVEGSIAAAANSVQLTGDQTIGGTKTFSSPIAGSITGNAATVTNGVYTTGDQTIGGVKTFSDPIVGSTNTQVSLTGNQTIGGVKTFSDPIVGSTNTQVSLTGNQTIAGTKTFSDPVRTNSITDAAGTGAPNFPNGLRLNTNAVLGPVTGDAPMYACRAWVNFNGTGTVAIRASGNVSSITDNGVGDYTINFTTAMPDANYAASLEARGSGLGGNGLASNSAVKTASSYRFQGARDSTGALHDTNENTVAIFR